MAQGNLILRLDRIYFVIEHLLVRELPDENSRRQYLSVAHDANGSQRKHLSKLWRQPEEVGEAQSFDEVLVSQRQRAEQVENWHGATKQQAYEDGNVRCRHFLVELVLGACIKIEES